MRLMPPSQFEPGSRARRTAGGFTLIEIMVALSILMLLLIIVFVPLNLGINIFNLGKTSAEVQQAANQTLAQIERDLTQAIYVYPNDRLPGVTDREPYALTAQPGVAQAPYLQDMTKDYAKDVQVCSAGTFRASNTARIDMLLARSVDGKILSPLEPEKYLVTYYARRLDPSTPYDQFTNPIVLYRAQLPYQDSAGNGNTAAALTTALNVQTSSDRYKLAGTCGGSSAIYNRGARWLAQNVYGEPELEDYDVTNTNYDPVELASNDAGSGTNLVPASHTLAIPRGMALVASNTDLVNTLDTFGMPLNSRRYAYIPDTSFTCSDTNNDGKIDRVAINLMIGQFDAVGAQEKRQTVQYPLTVDLPNIK